MDGKEGAGLLSGFGDFLKGERGLAPLTIRNYKTDLEPFF